MKVFFRKFIIIFLFIFSKNLFSQAFGNLASAVSFNICDTSTAKFYNITNNGVQSDAINPGGSFFNGSFLGDFYENTKTLNLTGGEVKSISYNDSKICEINLFYVVYEKNNRPASPVFLPLKLTNIYTCSDNGIFTDDFGSCYDTDNKKYVKYKNFDYQVDLTNRTPGNYVLEVYFAYKGDLGNTTNCNDQYFINNAHQNYRAEFTILSKPGSDVETGFCKGEGEISLFSLINSTDTSGTWSGPSDLGNGYLGTFDPATNEFGNYTYKISNTIGCSYTINVLVKNNTPIIKEVIVWDDYVEILPINGMISDYEYSLDAVTWQVSNRFYNLIKGIVYNAYIRQINGSCISDPKKFSLISISNFISPNGDGINDKINFYGTEFLENSNLEIFDSLGRKVYKEISQPNKIISWDGKDVGRNLPTSSYWYSLRLPYGKIYTGWIFLKNY